MDIQYGASVKEQQDKAMLQKAQMEIAARVHDTQMRTDTTAHDTVIKTQTQKEIETMKAQLALLLAQMDIKDLHEAESEAVERGI